VNRFTAQIHKIDKVIFAWPWLTMLIILAVTVFFALQIPAVRIVSDFADLLPQQHPYIQLHNSIRDTFGGANNVILSVEVEEGDVFNNDTLQRIHRLTEGVDSLAGINHNMMASLTHRTTRKVWLSEEGNVKSAPHFDPSKSSYTLEELGTMRREVVANPRVYGLLVSPDLKSALIRGTLIEGALDYEKVFNQLRELRERESTEGVSIYATGNPVLVGWVSSYVGQIVQIFLYTILIMLALLIVYFRKSLPAGFQPGSADAGDPLPDIGPGHVPRHPAGGALLPGTGGGPRPPPRCPHRLREPVPAGQPGGDLRRHRPDADFPGFGADQ
jgi:predicted RND superfamily exporter protein